MSRTGLAEEFEAQGRAVEGALVRGQAARLAPHRAALIESLCAMQRDAELALHQAIYEANQDGCSWRLLAKYTDMSWQTLHRRYRGRPARMRPPPERDTWLHRGRENAGMTKPARRREAQIPAQRPDPPGGSHLEARIGR